MKIYSKPGSKNRLFEMMKGVNGKQSIKEDYDSPKEKDKEYLDKSVDTNGTEITKLDGGLDYPVEKDLRVNSDEIHQEPVTESEHSAETDVQPSSPDLNNSQSASDPVVSELENMIAKIESNVEITYSDLEKARKVIFNAKQQKGMNEDGSWEAQQDLRQLQRDEMDEPSRQKAFERDLSEKMYDGLISNGFAIKNNNPHDITRIAIDRMRKDGLVDYDSEDGVDYFWLNKLGLSEIRSSDDVLDNYMYQSSGNDSESPYLRGYEPSP